MTPFRFEILHQSTRSDARVGIIHTPHGTIQTPGFVAVGTNGTLKALDNNLVCEIGLELMFCNTYHLMLQPGTDVVKQAGGLHSFIGRSLPIITDSGGFQVFSLAYGSVASELKSAGKKKNDGMVLKTNEEGVLFRSYRDGSKFLLTPETSIRAQKDLGADIIIPFDELPPYHISESGLIKSLDRTHRWEKRSLDEHLLNPQNQAMYAVIHGGINPDLRKKSCDYLSSLPFDGFAIGGSVGKNRAEMFEMLKGMVPRLPKEKPNHLLGIGDLASIDAVVPLGIDTMDSSYPTKAARHGLLFSSRGDIKVGQTIYKNRFEAPDPNCQCHTCRNYTLAYLHHLMKASEAAGQQLMTLHNLSFMVNLMATLRQKILQNEI